MAQSIYETLRYYPTGHHIVVQAPGLTPMIVETRRGLDVLVDGSACPVQAATASTADAVRAALRWADEATDWSEGAEAWDEVSYETRAHHGQIENI